MDEDAEIERSKKKKEEEAKKPGARLSVPGATGATGTVGVAGTAGVVVTEMSGGAWDETEEARIRRLMGRGSGEGLMEIDEGVLQICL